MVTNEALRSIRSISETVLALASTMALTLLLSVPFLPTAVELDFHLRPVPSAAPGRLSLRVLEQRVESLGLGDVEVLLDSDGNHLVLSDTEDDPELERQVLEILEQGGYEPELPVRRRQIRMESLKNPTVMAAQLTIQSVIFLAAGLLLARRRVLRDPAAAARSGPLRATLLGLAGGAAAILASHLLSNCLDAVGLPVQEQEWVREILAQPEALARLAPWMLLIAPVAEEVFFRGYAFRFIRQQAGFPAGLLVSSVLFAVIHFNLSGFILYLVIGCALAFVYENTANLLAPIAGHITVNSLALLYSLYDARP